MTKYRVGIARTETVVYYLDVEAEDEHIAEETATARYDEGEYDSKSTVFGEESVEFVDEVA